MDMLSTANALETAHDILDLFIAGKEILADEEWALHLGSADGRMKIELQSPHRTELWWVLDGDGVARRSELGAEERLQNFLRMKLIRKMQSRARSIEEALSASQTVPATHQGFGGPACGEADRLGDEAQALRARAEALA